MSRPRSARPSARRRTSPTLNLRGATEPSRHPWSQTALHLGQLARGGTRWDVYLESQPHPDIGAIRGRLHFLSGDRHRTSAWIFVEWTEKEVLDRARGFSAGELWAFLEGLTP